MKLATLILFLCLEPAALVKAASKGVLEEALGNVTPTIVFSSHPPPRSDAEVSGDKYTRQQGRRQQDLVDMAIALMPEEATVERVMFYLRDHVEYKRLKYNSAHGYSLTLKGMSDIRDASIAILRAAEILELYDA